MRSYFPRAKIYAFEAVEDYFQAAQANTQRAEDIKLFKRGVTTAHLFFDDLGKRPRPSPVSLVSLKGLPEAGPGWRGGSLVLPADHEMLAATTIRGYERTSQPVDPITLNEICTLIRKQEKTRVIDLVKFDCEGCECSALGCADIATLKAIRFMTGEYHDIERFYSIMQKKLFLTHKVNLIGSKDLGCFFAERLDGKKDAILRYDKSGMLLPRPWLSERPIDWHLFNEEFVPPEQRYWHALP